MRQIHFTLETIILSLDGKLVVKGKQGNTDGGAREKISTEIVSDELQTSPVTQFLEEIFMWK